MFDKRATIWIQNGVPRVLKTPTNMAIEEKIKNQTPAKDEQLYLLFFLKAISFENRQICEKHMVCPLCFF